MRDIGDCPEIKRALATGYPYPPKERPTVICDDCGAELTDDSPVFDFGEYLLCERCARKRIQEDFPIQEETYDG